jgi:hypothetical protein
MADEDIAFERHIKQRAREMGALMVFLDERGITDHELRSRVHGTDNWLGRFDDREARRFELDQMERWFWTDTAWQPVCAAGGGALAAAPAASRG